MTEDNEGRDTPSMLDWLQIPATKTYMIVGFMALFLYYLLMMDRTGVFGTLITVLAAIPALVGRGVISPALFLIFNTYLIFDPEFGGLVAILSNPGYGNRDSYGFGRHYFSARRPYSFDIQDFLVSLAVMAYLMAQYRLFSLMREGIPDDPAPLRKGQGKPPPIRRPARHFDDRELARMLALGGFCVVVGQLSWWLLTAIDNGFGFSASWTFNPRQWGKALLFLWIVSCLLLLAAAVFYHVRLWRMSASEARLIVQDALWQETHREQERIYRWQKWYRARQDRHKEDPSTVKRDKS